MRGSTRRPCLALSNRHPCIPRTPNDRHQLLSALHTALSLTNVWCLRKKYAWEGDEGEGDHDMYIFTAACRAWHSMTMVPASVAQIKL